MNWRYDIVLVAAVICMGVSVPAAAGESKPLVTIDTSSRWQVALDAQSPTGEASLREHATCWHPGKRKYYLIADVVPLASEHHPNSYDTDLHLWSSEDLAAWTYHGVAVPRSTTSGAHDRNGAASPSGLALYDGRLHVAYSGRRGRFNLRDIGLAWSGADPEQLPWTKTAVPITGRPDSEDDDAALAVREGDDRLHLYHRATAPGGYRIVHTASATPHDPASWPAAEPVCERPADVRAQELTAAVFVGQVGHLFIIEHRTKGGIAIAHLVSDDPAGPFRPASESRYLPPGSQPRHLAYSGHISPVLRDGAVVGWSWTVPQAGKRYGVLGHRGTLSNPTDLSSTEAP